MPLFSSLFKKKFPKAPSTVNPLVGAELMPEEGLPEGINEDEAGAIDYGTVKAFNYSGESPNFVFEEGRPISVSNTAYIITPKSNLAQPVAFINIEREMRFEAWNLDDDFKLISPIDINDIHPEQHKWKFSLVKDLHCLPNGILVFTIKHLEPHSKTSLYSYSIKNRIFRLINKNDSHNVETSSYAKKYQISDDSAIILYYSELIRRSAEIYHNYYNYLMLFSPEYPDGMEFLKLGIDNGNIESLKLQNKTLFLETWDTRIRGNAKQQFFSLNLNAIIQDDSTINLI